MTLEQSIANLNDQELIKTLRRERIRQAAIRAGIYAEKEDNISASQKILEVSEQEAEQRNLEIVQ